jgi:Leucine-rich repeat (LRR) protein
MFLVSLTIVYGVPVPFDGNCSKVPASTVYLATVDVLRSMQALAVPVDSFGGQWGKKDVHMCCWSSTALQCEEEGKGQVEIGVVDLSALGLHQLHVPKPLSSATMAFDSRLIFKVSSNGALSTLTFAGNGTSGMGISELFADATSIVPDPSWSLLGDDLAFLELSYTNVTSAPPMLASWTSLGELRLSGNAIDHLDVSAAPGLFAVTADGTNFRSARWPSSLGSLKVDRNEWHGVLPWDLCAQRDTLQSLWLSEVGLTSLPACRMAALQTLVLSDNELSTLNPDFVTPGVNISFLDVSSNHLTDGGLAPFVERLATRALTDLALAGNVGITTFPPKLCAVDHMISLDLSYCNLTDLPPCHFVGVFQVSLSGNEALVEVTDDFVTASPDAALNTLGTLSLENCTSLRRLPVNLIAASRQMTSLSLGGSSALAHEYPSLLATLFPHGSPSLVALDVSGIRQSAVLPADWCQGFPRLSFLDVTATSMSSVDPWLCACSNITIFMAGENAIGHLPPCLSSALPRLSTLAIGSALDDSQLAPLLERTKNESMPVLELLDLSGNRLTSPPVPIFAAARSLILARNQLRSFPLGGIQTLLSGEPLTWLDLSENELSGPIPFLDAPPSNKARAVVLNLLSFAHNVGLTGRIPFWPVTQLRLEGCPRLRMAASLPPDARPLVPDNSFSVWADVAIDHSILSRHEGGYTCATLYRRPQRFFYTNQASDGTFTSTALSLPTRGSLTVDPTYLDYAHCHCAPTLLGTPPSSCVPCSLLGGADELNCTGGGSVATYQPGLAPVRTDAGRLVGFTPCPLPAGCNPGGNGTVRLDAVDGGGAGDDVCADGYEGRACARCSCDDTACRWPDEATASCRPCGPPPSLLTRSLIAVALAVAVLIALAVGESRRQRFVLVAEIAVLLAFGLFLEGSEALISLGLLLVALHAASLAQRSPFSDHGASHSLVRLLVFHMQTLQQVTYGVALLPSWAKTVVESITFFAARDTGIRCLVRGWLSPSAAATFASEPALRLGSLLALPLALSAVSALILAARHHLVQRLRGESKDDEGTGLPVDESTSLVTRPPPTTKPRPHWTLSWQQTTLLILHVLYFELVFAAFSALRCTSASAVEASVANDPTLSYATVAPWLPCDADSPRYARLLGMGALGLLVLVVGVPLMYVWLLVKPGAGQDDARDILTAGWASNRRSVGEVWWTLRRVAIAAAASLAPPTLAPPLITLVLISAVASAKILAPFASVTAARLDDQSLAVLALTVSAVAAGVSHESAAEGEAKLPVATTVLVLGSNILVVCAIFASTLQCTLRREKRVN